MSARRQADVPASRGEAGTILPRAGSPDTESPGKAALVRLRRVLIIKLGAIGDVIMAIPGVHALHAEGFAVDWICGAAALPVLETFPWIRPIVADEQAILKTGGVRRARALFGLWAHMAGRRYDLVATLYYDRRYRVLALPVRAKRRLHLSHTDRAFRLLPGRHHTDEFARILLGRPDEVRPVPLAPVRAARLPVSPLPRTAQRRVILTPAGARNLMAEDALRRWPAELYVELARELLAAGIEVLLSGGPGDAWAEPLFASLPVTNLIGKLSLDQTLALFDAADLLVTHDTGPLHLAGITAISIVAVFGPTDPRTRLPQRPGALAFWGGEGFACRPCYDGVHFARCPANECMRQVSVAAVLAQVLASLDDRDRGTLAAPTVLTPPSTVAAGELLQLPRGARP